MSYEDRVTEQDRLPLSGIVRLGDLGFLYKYWATNDNFVNRRII